MVAALLIAGLAQVPAPALSGDRSVTSKCEVSDDRRYGYSIDNPIRVGGLPIYGASRQQRYLRALGGPAGQAVTFRPHYGVAIDRFRYVAAAARGQIAMGQPVTPEALTGVFGDQFFVIAHPVKCDGKTRRPRGVLVRGANGLVAKPRRVLDASAVRAFFSWVKVPDGALGAMFTGPHPPPGGEVAIGYDGPACQGESDTVVLPVKAGPPEKIADARPVWPADIHPTTLSEPAVVEVRARIGVDGVPGDLEALSGPPAFLEPALDAVRQWRYSPFTINGAPAYAPIVMTVRVTFSRKEGGDSWPD